MNSILANGVARFNSGNNNNYFDFEYQSTIIGENAGKNLKLLANTLARNYFNVFIGNNSGLNTLKSLNNTFVGYQSGMNIEAGSNNIILGQELDTGRVYDVYNVLSVGLGNRTFNNSISIGSSNLNTGNNSSVIGKNNISDGDDNICIGKDNIQSNMTKSIIIGNSSGMVGQTNSNISSNVILIGNNLSNLSGSTIMIGNDLNPIFNLNIGDALLRYKDTSNTETIMIGNTCNAINVMVGYSDIDLLNFERYRQTSNIVDNGMYVKYGINAQSLTLGNAVNTTSNYTISLNISSNLHSNIAYTLPDYPINANMVLSSRENGTLYWKTADASLSLASTDMLKQGTSNLYYSPSIVDNRVDARMDAVFYQKFDYNYDKRLVNLNLDMITDGTSNNYITNGIYNRDLLVFGTLTVNKLKVLGTDMKGENTFDQYINRLVSNSSNDLKKYVDDKFVVLDQSMSNMMLNLFESIKP